MNNVPKVVFSRTNEKAKEWSRNAFNRRAAKYENTLAGWHSRGMKEGALRHVDRSTRGSLLDVGCGPGLLLEVLAGQDGGLDLAGLDITPEMIRVAKERLGARADLRVGDAESLPWEDGRFDYLLCVDSFHHYPNPERALAQMRRVLKRSGRLVIADPLVPPVLRQMANLITPLLRRGDVRMYGKREMEGMLEARGFEQTEWETSGLGGFVVTALAR
jgi:ubiquinone/menaquinone biosynthesis C-methylase UbiE